MPVGAFRCASCGYLESYARGEKTKVEELRGMTATVLSNRKNQCAKQVESINQVTSVARYSVTPCLAPKWSRHDTGGEAGVP
jgi:hypothetical protein